MGLVWLFAKIQIMNIIVKYFAIIFFFFDKMLKEILSKLLNCKVVWSHIHFELIIFIKKMYLIEIFFLLGVYNQRKTTAPSTAAPPYSSGGNLIPTSSQPHSFSSTTTPMGPILPLAPYELKHPTLSSGVSQPLSSIGNDFPGISRVTSTSGPVPTRRSNLSNTLPSPRRRQQMKEMLEAKPSSKDDSSGVKPQNVRLLFLLG